MAFYQQNPDHFVGRVLNPEGLNKRWRGKVVYFDTEASGASTSEQANNFCDSVKPGTKANPTTVAFVLYRMTEDSVATCAD